MMISATEITQSLTKEGFEVTDVSFDPVSLRVEVSGGLPGHHCICGIKYPRDVHDIIIGALHVFSNNAQEASAA